MRELKLIICDVDGTLIGFENRVFTSETKQAIEQLREHGYYFGVASGRALETQGYQFYKEWGFDRQFEILIGANGSQLYDGLTDKVYHDHYIDIEGIKEIYAVMKPFHLVSTIYVGDTSLCWAEDNEGMAYFYEHYKHGKYRIVSSIEEMWEQETGKIMFRTTDEDIPMIVDYIQAHGNVEKYHAFRTSPGTLEFAHPLATKGNALRKFCKLHDISLDEVAAFGDATNDLDMLQAAGLGVCMVNGTDDVKAIADVITEKSADDNGFANYVEKEILG